MTCPDFTLLAVIFTLGGAILCFFSFGIIKDIVQDRSIRKELDESIRKSNENLAKFFPAVIEEFKKEGKEITNESSFTSESGDTTCRFRYKGFYFFLRVSRYDVVEIAREGRNVSSQSVISEQDLREVLKLLFFETDGLQTRLELVMRKLVRRLKDHYWDFERDRSHHGEIRKDFKSGENHLTVYVSERRIGAGIMGKDGKTWAKIEVEVNDNMDHFNSAIEVFSKIHQWEEFM